MMKRFAVILACLIFAASAGPAQADCNIAPSGTRPEGVIVYNRDYSVYQYCAGTEWKAIVWNKTTCDYGTAPYWSDWAVISPGQHFTCGVRSNGTAWCWGESEFGKLGTGDLPSLYQSWITHIPVRVGTSGTSTLFSDWSMTDAGDHYACGVRTNGTAWCWGRADSPYHGGTASRLGNNLTTDSDVPVQVGTAGTSTLFTDWLKVRVGYGHACGVRTNGTAWCWGEGGDGQLGRNSTTDSNVPVQVGTAGTSTLFTDWTLVAAGSEYSCGVRSNGTAWCWGANGAGNLGNNTSTPSNVPVQVGTVGTSTLFADWTQIAADNFGTTCGVRANGTAWCWGSRYVGATGTGETDTTGGLLVPKQVGTAGTSTLFTDWTVVEGSVNIGTFCGIRSNGTAWCWGNSSGGQLGSGLVNYDFDAVGSNVPVQVGGGSQCSDFTDWQKIDVGTSVTCGIRSDDTAWCWGRFDSITPLGIDPSVFAVPHRVVSDGT